MKRIRYNRHEGDVIREHKFQVGDAVRVSGLHKDFTAIVRAAYYGSANTALDRTILYDVTPFPEWRNVPEFHSAWREDRLALLDPLSAAILKEQWPSLNATT